MTVRRVSYALVCSVFLAAVGASAGSSYAATTADTLSASAYQALTAGDANKSVDLFSQAIGSQQLGPEALANCYLNRALAFQKLGQSDKAVDDYTSALNLDAMPTDIRARALYNRGLAQEKAGHSVLAIEDYTSSLLINANFSQSYLARANALRDSGQYLFSISDYERAIKNNHPQPAVVFFGEAQAYEALKRPAEAKQFLQAAVAADPHFAPAAEKLKSYDDVAEADDVTADPVMTGSITSPNNETKVAMQLAPKAVEPPASMVAEAQKANDANAQDAADQIADAADSMGDALPAKFGRVEVADIPVIPANAKTAPQQVAEAKPVVKAAAPKVEQVAQVAPKAVIQPAGDIVDTDADNVSTASTEPAADAPAAAPMTGWVVQVSSAGSEDAAWNTWKAMQKAHVILAGEKASVVKADLGAKGTFFRVRLGGYNDQATAQKACGKFKAGGVTCFVSKAES